MDEVESKYFFTYGTLRDLSLNPYRNIIRVMAKFRGRAYMRGRLYLVKDDSLYPAAVYHSRSPDIVFGELWEIPVRFQGPLFSQWDEYEGCSERFPKPWEYVRKLVVVRQKWRRFEAWCYVYNWPVSKLDPIDSGDFLSVL